MTNDELQKIGMQYRAMKREEQERMSHESDEMDCGDLDALRAENAKLREALQEISRYLENPDTQFAVPMIAIVRAALA